MRVRRFFSRLRQSLVSLLQRKPSTTLVVKTGNRKEKIDIYTAEGFELLSHLWVKSAWQHRYHRRFTWLGFPILQLPADIVALQMLIHQVKPNVIIETGTYAGGGTIYYASLLHLLGGGHVISIDVKVEPEDRQAILNHPLAEYITLIEGNSIGAETISKVRERLQPGDHVLVLLDSNHSYQHVKAELEMYAPLVSSGSYLVVMDGIMQDLTDAPRGRRNWDVDNPLRALREFVSQHPSFEIDLSYTQSGITNCPDGFLRHK